ncbi:unnamed protein product [Symbiodinium sp. CCMP2592]|nr:unnamed protein product [Symbiodinium sp. CCMP2592]
MSDPGRFCVSGSSSIGLTSEGSTEQEGSADAVASSKNSAASSSSSDEGNVVEEVGENVASQESLVRHCMEKFESGVKDTTLDKLQLPEDWIEEIKETWLAFVERSGSRQAAGEAVWDAVMELSPHLQKSFRFSRHVFAVRFMNGTSSLIADAGNPEALKDKAEKLAFQHMNAVSLDNVETFVTGITTAMDGELGHRFSEVSFQSFRVLFNYIGGIFLFVKREYGERVRRILRSWQDANKYSAEQREPSEVLGDVPAQAPGQKEPDVDLRTGGDNKAAQRKKVIETPQTFRDMFMFNASVMGYADTDWMSCTLDYLGAMANNADKPYRIQEECHVLALILNRHYVPKGRKTVSLVSFKTVLLASLRSVMPQDWDMDLEEAWTWFWGQIARTLSGCLAKVSRYRRSLQQLITNLSEDDLSTFRGSIFDKFFETSPGARNHLKVSATRLWYVVDNILLLAMEIYSEPSVKVQEVSAVGLRHVGMSIPSQFFAPLADALVESMKPYVDAGRQLALESLRWSMELLAQIMTRVNVEGSTLVMKAVSQNDPLALRRALAIAPRGQRVQEVLTVTVGSQSISPLYWSIETGHLACARTIIQDLMTIRGDRSTYYFGCDDLFHRHPDVISKMSALAPELLWPLLDGLIWRSRIVKGELRRAIYYVKNLIQDSSGNFSENIAFLAEHGDPQVIVHPAVMKAVDVIWYRLAMFRFVLQRLYSIFTLCVLLTGQSLLHGSTSRENIIVAACRGLTYVFGLGPLLCQHVLHFLRDAMARRMVRTIIGPIPRYLLSPEWFSSAVLLFVLIAMLSLEPVIWCLYYGSSQGDLLTRSCPQSDPVRDWYSAISALAVMLHWCLVLLDLSIFSTRVLAFLLACSYVASQVALTIAAAFFFVFSFATAINAMDHTLVELDGVQSWVLVLSQITLGTVPSDVWQSIHADASVQIMVGVFCIIMVTFVLNLLVAQMVASYGQCFTDLQGFARLNRTSHLAEMADRIPRRRWSAFLETLHLEEPLEFSEGDRGPAGGLQVLEPAKAHLVIQDSVQRFSGSTSPDTPWPEPKEHKDGFERLEQMLLKLRQTERRKGGHSSSGASGLSGRSPFSLSPESENSPRDAEPHPDSPTRSLPSPSRSLRVPDL